MTQCLTDPAASSWRGRSGETAGGGRRPAPGARRGALRSPLPVGLVYDPAGKVALDPDGQVRHSITHLFETFERTGSAPASGRPFRTQPQVDFVGRALPGDAGQPFQQPFHPLILEELHAGTRFGSRSLGRILVQEQQIQV